MLWADRGGGLFLLTYHFRPSDAAVRRNRRGERMNDTTTSPSPSTVEPAELRVIRYPHPTLRHPSKPLKRIDRAVQDIVRRMFELMYEHNGIGLAANQVDLPYRLFVLNLKGKPNEGEERVFINPILMPPKESRRPRKAA